MKTANPTAATIVCTALLLHGLSACSPGPAPSAARPEASARSPAPLILPAGGHVRSVASKLTPGRATEEFKRFALNALLVPLLDDEVPERWADPSPLIDCVDAAVSVDGAHLDVGAPVGDAFRLHWRMDGCTPLGEHLELSGAVELQVLRRDGRYTARVQPQSLRVASADGVDVLLEPFDAELTNTPDLPR